MPGVALPMEPLLVLVLLPVAIGVAAGSFVAIRRFRVNVVWVIIAAGIVGLVRAVTG